MPVAFAIAMVMQKFFFDARSTRCVIAKTGFIGGSFEGSMYVPVQEVRLPLGGMSTVNYSLAKAYEENFSVKPIVITNAADYFDLPVLSRNDGAYSSCALLAF